MAAHSMQYHIHGTAQYALTILTFYAGALAFADAAATGVALAENNPAHIDPHDVTLMTSSYTRLVQPSFRPFFNRGGADLIIY